MTPAALTPAARAATKRRTPKRTPGTPRTSSARSAGHRGPVRGAAAPRRVSGPATAAPRRRRVSGPVRGATTTRPSPRRSGARPITLPRPGLLAARASVFVRTLPDHRLLDRVVRGRSWIPILGLLLTGIVAMQVETLRLGASTGRSLERVTALQSLNQQLRASVAVLGDDQRIERLAAGMNMVMPGPTQVRFLASHGGSVSRALGSVHAPDSATFLAALPAAASTVTAAGSTSSATPPATPTATVPATPAATPAVASSAPVSSSGATVTGVAPASTAVTPTAPSATNTGVASTGASAASSPPASSGTPASVAPVVPSATTPNGAAGVPSGG